jgi:hypothetical protein
MRAFGSRPDTFVSDEPFYAHYLYKTGKKHPLRKNITGKIPNGKQVWYQKHMSQHNLPGDDLGWIKKMRNVFLIRNPRDVILSYIKKGDLTSIDQLGYPQQITLFNMMKNNRKVNPYIIDACDVLNNPKKILSHLCKKLDIPFYQEMLTWRVGHHKTDGIWGKYWYDSVVTTTRFQTYIKYDASLPSKYNDIYKECMDHYNELYQYRMG